MPKKPHANPVPQRAVDTVTTGVMGHDAAELHSAANNLQSAIFNSANFSCIATDARGIIQIFNVGAEHLLGYAADDVVNKLNERARALSAEFKTPIAPGFEALSYKASCGLEDIYELTYIQKNGGQLPAVVSVTALRDAHGSVIGYLMISIDNTARKKDEDAQKIA